MKIERTTGSLKVKEITDLSIEETPFKQHKGFKDLLALYTGKNKGKNVFVLQVAYWSFDDADEWYHIFDNKAAALASFNDYSTPISKKPFSKTTIATLEYQDGTTKKKPAQNHKGYIVQSFYDGEELKPFFNRGKLLKDGMLDECITFVKKLTKDEDNDIRNVIGTKYESYLLKIGKNENGPTITLDGDEVNPTKEINFETHDCWETGLVYKRLINRVPTEIFKQLDLWYHAEEIEEEGDWKGWCAGNDTMAAIENLKKQGWTSNLNQL